MGHVTWPIYTMGMVVGNFFRNPVEMGDLMDYTKKNRGMCDSSDENDPLDQQRINLTRQKWGMWFDFIKKM